MHLAVLTMCRDESRRYLPGLLDAWRTFADSIIAYEDHSTDNTRKLLEDAGAQIVEPVNDQMWGNEQQPRRALFDAAVGTDADWFLWLDADMIPARNPREVFETTSADAVAFGLFDLWNTDPLMYRSDAYWFGHNSPRIWAMRNPGTSTQFEWAERGIHCGHLPAGYRPKRVVIAPRRYALLHYGYADEVDRMQKHEAYMAQAHQLSEFEAAHANSIIDPDPFLLPLDVDVQWDIQRKTQTP